MYYHSVSKYEVENNNGYYLSTMQKILQKENITKCPNQIFIEDLVKFIMQVKAEGNKVILAVDANKLVADSQLSILLK